MVTCVCLADRDPCQPAWVTTVLIRGAVRSPSWPLPHLCIRSTLKRALPSNMQAANFRTLSFGPERDAGPKQETRSRCHSTASLPSHLFCLVHLHARVLAPMTQLGNVHALREPRGLWGPCVGPQLKIQLPVSAEHSSPCFISSLSTRPQGLSGQMVFPASGTWQGTAQSALPCVDDALWN